MNTVVARILLITNYNVMIARKISGTGLPHRPLTHTHTLTKARSSKFSTYT